MLQHKPQEIFAFQRTIAGFAGTAFHVLKGDVSVSTGDDVVFKNDICLDPSFNRINARWSLNNLQLIQIRSRNEY